MSFFDLHMQIRTFADATRENYLYMWNHFVRDDLGRRSVTQIRKSDILKFYAKHKENGVGKRYDPYLSEVVKTSFQLAVDDHIISENPADGCCKNYPEEDADKSALTEEQMEIFMNCLAKMRTKQRYDLIFPRYGRNLLSYW